MPCTQNNDQETIYWVNENIPFLQKLLVSFWFWPTRIIWNENLLKKDNLKIGKINTKYYTTSKDFLPGYSFKNTFVKPISAFTKIQHQLKRCNFKNNCIVFISWRTAILEAVECRHDESYSRVGNHITPLHLVDMNKFSHHKLCAWFSMLNFSQIEEIYIWLCA